VAVVLPCSDLGELLEALSCGGASIEELDLSRNDITDTGALPLLAALKLVAHDDGAVRHKVYRLQLDTAARIGVGQPLWFTLASRWEE
jgi:hypothetical protein